jgi:hypothetical protein
MGFVFFWFFLGGGFCNEFGLAKGLLDLTRRRIRETSEYKQRHE